MIFDEKVATNFRCLSFENFVFEHFVFFMAGDRDLREREREKTLLASADFFTAQIQIGCKCTKRHYTWGWFYSVVVVGYNWLDRTLMGLVKKIILASPYCLQKCSPGYLGTGVVWEGADWWEYLKIVHLWGLSGEKYCSVQTSYLFKGRLHCAKKPVTTMVTYPWKCTVLHCNHLGNTWKPLVLMT